MKNLNLCTDPWLPVRMSSGACVRVSLEEFFSKAHEISDLILAAHERISIMRLLICITQRALDGPEDREEWEDCKEDIIPKTLIYLEKWRAAFDLLGEDGAFLQVSGVSYSSGNWKGLSKLNLSSAEGNNHTVFDNAATTERSVEVERLAIDLVTFQNFAPCGIIGQVNWNGDTYPDSNTAPDAPCVVKSVVHMFYIGENMLETIWLNLCTKEEANSVFASFGKPVWEGMPNSRNDEDSIENAKETYLGRLVPLSRIVKIDYEGNRCLLAKGIEIPVCKVNELLYFEPFTTVVFKHDSDERVLVSADMSYDMWRHLPALLHRFNDKGYTLGKLDSSDFPQHYGIWAGALVSSKAKILDTMEDYYEHLSSQSVGAGVEIMHYKLMEYAKRGCNMCWNAVKKYRELLVENRRERQITDNENSNTEIKQRLEREYWRLMTLHKEKFVNLVCLKMDTKEWECELKRWLVVICDSSKETYEAFTQRDSVRRLAAWAQALSFLPNTRKLLKDE